MEDGIVPFPRESRPGKAKLYAVLAFSTALALLPLCIEGTNFHIALIASGWIAVFIGAFFVVRRRAWWLLVTLPLLLFTGFVSALNHAIFSNVGHPPPIAQDVHFVMKGMPVADVEWTATLRRHFPLGTSETKVEATLKAQGFLIDQRNHVARYEWQEPFCRVIIEAQWTTGPDQRITSIEGVSAGMCL